MGVYKGLLLYVDYISLGNSDIYIYDIFTGKCYGKYHVSISGEFESIDYDSTNKRFVMLFSQPSTIYTTSKIDIEKFVNKK